MKYLILTAALLLSTAAFSEDTTQAPAVPTSEAAATHAPAQPEPSKATQAPAAAPVQPTAWNIEGLDASDLATLNAALEELPFKVYKQFTARLQSKIRPVK